MKVLSKQCQQNSKTSNKETKFFADLHSWEDFAELRQLNTPITARHWTRLTVIRYRVEPMNSVNVRDPLNFHQYNLKKYV